MVLKFADWTAPAIQEAYGLGGVSIPHGNAVIFAPVGMAVNWAIEKVSALAKIDWSPDALEERFGGLVQPSTIGFIMGIVLGIVGGQDFGQTLYLGIIIAAFMIVFPRAENVLVEGITPVADGMREVCGKRFHRILLASTRLSSSACPTLWRPASCLPPSCSFSPVAQAESRRRTSP